MSTHLPSVDRELCDIAGIVLYEPAECSTRPDCAVLDRVAHQVECGAVIVDFGQQPV
jgi:hypothetical protein